MRLFLRPSGEKCLAIFAFRWSSFITMLLPYFSSIDKMYFASGNLTSSTMKLFKFICVLIPRTRAYPVSSRMIISVWFPFRVKVIRIYFLSKNHKWENEGKAKFIIVRFLRLIRNLFDLPEEWIIGVRRLLAAVNHRVAKGINGRIQSFTF